MNQIEIKQQLSTEIPLLIYNQTAISVSSNPNLNQNLAAMDNQKLKNENYINN